MLQTTLITVLSLTLVGMSDGPRKKGGLSPDAMWTGADAVVGGEIHDIAPDGVSYLTGTLYAVVHYRGACPDTLRIRLYGPEEHEGRCAVWFLKRAADGSYGEEYPWMRAGPETFLGWPGKLVDRILEPLPHAWSEGRDGLRAIMIEAPHLPGRRVLWLVVAPEDSADPAAGAITATLEVRDSLGRHQIAVRAAESRGPTAPRAFENDPPVLPGAVVVPGAGSADYRARITLPERRDTLSVRLVSTPR